MRQQLRRLRQALSEPQTLAIRRRAVQLVGVLSGIAGNLSLDTGRDDQAVTFFELGRLAGSEADDGDLTAWVLATHSIAPFFAGRPAEAAALLDEASELARRASGPRRRAWIQAHRARAHAAAGDGATAVACLDSARAAMDSVADPPYGTDFFDGPRLDGLAGGMYLLLRDPDGATELLSRALTGRAPADAKGRALLTLDLAEARVIAGDLDHASELAGQALDTARGAVVRPILARAKALRADMEPWGPTRAAARLDSRLADLARGADREE